MCHDNLYTSQLAALPCPTLYVNIYQIKLYVSRPSRHGAERYSRIISLVKNI
jgi:hypothetical protein